MCGPSQQGDACGHNEVSPPGAGPVAPVLERVASVEARDVTGGTHLSPLLAPVEDERGPGSFAEVVANPNSLTGQYLSGAKEIAIPARRRPRSC